MLPTTLHRLHRLNGLVQRLSADARARHAFFLLAALASILISGYHFGTFDQYAHITFLKYYADPGLFPRDEFVRLMSGQNYSYFWRLFVPIYQLDLAYGQNIPEALRPIFLGSTMLAAHVAVTYVTFWRLWRLSVELFDSTMTAFFSVLALIIPHVGFGGFMALEFSLLNRTFALPFLLWALTLYLQRRYRPAFFIAGAMFNIHVISVNFVLAMFALDAARRWRDIGWRTLAASAGLFLVAAAPVLIWRLTDPTAAMPADPEWFAVMTRGTLYNLFFLIAPYFHINLITLFGLSTLLMFFVGWKWAPSRRHNASLLNFCLALIAILLVQIVTAQFWPITLIVQLQIIRAGVFVMLLGYLYFVHYTLTALPDAQSEWDFFFLIATTVVAPMPLFPAAVWLLQRWVRSARARLAATVTAVVASVVFGAWLLVTLDLWSPGLHPFGPRNAWYDAQRWAREHTPRDAVFITPPEQWWLYDSDWRVFSERATVVSHIELIMVAIAPSYFPEWRERFEQVAPGAIARFGGNYFDNRAIVREAFYTLSLAELRRIGARYGAGYVVMEKPNQRDLPLLYENEQFTIYALR
jgi:hypothetical protein